MNTITATKSQTDTHTEARARYVMGKIYDDFNSILFRGFTTVNTTNLKSWRDDIQYVMEKNALHHFEVQFSFGDKQWAVRYEVDKSGGISRDDDSGGLDFYNIPAGASLNITLRRDKDNIAVSEYLATKGWGSGGTFIAEESNSSRSFSKDGFGVNRKILGDI